MKTFFATLLACLACLPYAATAAAPERTEFEKQVIGRKWKNTILSFNIHPLAGQCTALSSQMLQQDNDLGLYNYLCSDGRVASIIAEWMDPERTTSKALDAFLFPLPKEGEKLMFTGDCSLNGSTRTDFTALVRMGDHESVDWQTGVIAAWLPNVTTQKYEPLSTRYIVCDVPTPP